MQIRWSVSFRQVVVIAGLLVLSGCGGSDQSEEGSSSFDDTATSGQVGPTSPAPTAPIGSAVTSASVAARPGCGTYCKQASYPAADDVDGYPCPTSGCHPCPAGGCVSLLSPSAAVIDGVFTARMTCNLPTTCQGAFLVCARGALCGDSPTDLTMGVGGRLAASDFTLDSRRTADVPVALTETGMHFVSQPGGFNGDVLVNLQDYGHALKTTSSASPPFLLTTRDRPAFPAGAVAGCGGVVFVGPDTSCPFAANVHEAYKSARSTSALTVLSPTTGITYTVRCASRSPHVCTTDSGATVYFY